MLKHRLQGERERANVEELRWLTFEQEILRFTKEPGLYKKKIY